MDVTGERVNVGGGGDAKGVASAYVGSGKVGVVGD